MLFKTKLEIFFIFIVMLLGIGVMVSSVQANRITQEALDRLSKENPEVLESLGKGTHIDSLKLNKCITKWNGNSAPSPDYTFACLLQAAKH